MKPATRKDKKAPKDEKTPCKFTPFNTLIFHIFVWRLFVFLPGVNFCVFFFVVILSFRFAFLHYSIFLRGIFSKFWSFRLAFSVISSFASRFFVILSFRLASFHYSIVLAGVNLSFCVVRYNMAGCAKPYIEALKKIDKLLFDSLFARFRFPLQLPKEWWLLRST